MSSRWSILVLCAAVSLSAVEVLATPFGAIPVQFQPSCREVLLPPELRKAVDLNTVPTADQARIIETLTSHFRRLSVQKIRFWQDDFVEKFNLVDYFGRPIGADSINVEYRMSRWRKKDGANAVRITIMSMHKVLSNGELPKDGADVGLSRAFHEFLIGLIMALNEMAKLDSKLTTIEIVGKSINPSLGNFFRKRGFEFQKMVEDRVLFWGTPTASREAWAGRIQIQVHN